MTAKLRRHAGAWGSGNVLVQALVISQLLQLALGWCVCMCHPTPASHPECSSLAGLHPTQDLPHYTAPPHPALATSAAGI